MSQPPSYQDLQRKIAQLEGTEADLRQELKMLEHATQSLPGIYYLFDERGRFLRWNRNFEDVSGYSGEELSEMSPLDFFVGRDRERVAERIGETFTAGRSAVEAEFVTKSGQRIWHYFTGFRTIIDDRRYLVGMGIDISSLKRTEDALRNFQMAVDSASDAIGISTREGVHYYQNRAFDELFGTISKDPPASLYVDEAAGRRIFEELKAGGQWSGEITMRGKDGDTLEIFLRAYAIKDHQGEVAGLVGVHTDITERKRAQEERLELERHLQRAQRLEAVGTLAGGIAHDFNNILGAVMGNAELASLELPRDHPVAGYLDRVLAASARAKDVVQQILTFSMQSDRKELPVRLAGVVGEGLELMRATIPTTIDICAHVDEEAGAVLVDLTEIHQVLVNLCTNAAHAMRDTGGVLTVDLRDVDLVAGDSGPELPPGPYLRLAVADTGHGIPPELRDRIFEPYFTTKDKGVGTGLGLSVAHGIVKRHGGEITVTSGRGRGTTFAVYLPRLPDAAPVEVDHQLETPRGTERILLVDDEPALVEIGERMLQRLGYTVTTRGSAAEGLDILRARPEDFDLLITDQTMPGMAGDALARTVLQECPGFPIILCSGFSETVNEASLREAGVQAYLMKPFTMSALATAVRSALDTRD